MTNLLIIIKLYTTKTAIIDFIYYTLYETSTLANIQFNASDGNVLKMYNK